MASGVDGVKVVCKADSRDMNAQSVTLITFMLRMQDVGAQRCNGVKEMLKKFKVKQKEISYMLFCKTKMCVIGVSAQSMKYLSFRHWSENANTRFYGKNI